MGWFEKQSTPLGRVGLIGYAFRWIVTAIASVLLVTTVIRLIVWLSVKLAS